MNICMVVCNNLTTDNRVLREAQTLQAAGHQVSVVGIAGAETRSEVLPGGVRLIRVDWRGPARRRLLIRAIPWAVFILLLCGIAIWVAVRLAAFLGKALPPLLGGVALGMAMFFHAAWQAQVPIILASVFLAIALAILGRAVANLHRSSAARASAAESERNAMLRNTGALSAQDSSGPVEFPQPRSWVPQWVPPELIDALAVPLAFLGRRFAQFALSQERARQMAKQVLELRPDVIHAHDCTALPVAALVKRALGVPVIYDAHEIYAEAAVRRRGVVDYYILLHRQYLPIVDRFITVNQSIAEYYRQVHPKLSPAVVIRNAATRMSAWVYDGRLHEAAGLPRSEKILLYQGGFSALRGLQELVRSASCLPAGWTLVMMGWGPLEGELRAVALSERRRLSQEGGEGYGDPDKVRFVAGAPRADVLLWTAGASLGIIPYDGSVLNHWFCSPNKLWEFPSAGVPLIVQPFPELRKVVEKYRCGWILPQACTRATLAEMIGAITEEEFREAREGCRRFIEDDSWESAYVRPLTELYASLDVKANPIPGPIKMTAQQGAADSVRKTNSRLAT